MRLLDLAKTIFGSVEFGSDFLIELIMLVILLHFIDIVSDMSRGGRR